MFLRSQAFSLLVLIMLSRRSEAESSNRPATGEQLSCPTYWTKWRNNCYRYFGAEVSWRDALNYCRLLSTEDEGNREDTADLVSIHSQEEQDFVYHYWKSLREVDERSRKPGLWIGLNDYDQDGVHVWTDGSVVDYTNFDNGQAAHEEQYYYFLGDWEDEDSSPYGKWHDIFERSDWYFQFMCKMAAHPSAEQ